jgi:hypothetical protein
VPTGGPRISQKLRACPPVVIPHQAPALRRDAPPKNRENRENHVGRVAPVPWPGARSSRRDTAQENPGRGAAVLLCSAYQVKQRVCARQRSRTVVL